MKIPVRSLLIVVLAAVPALAGARENVDRALREITSPFRETRRRAVESLVAEGEAADGPCGRPTGRRFRSCGRGSSRSRRGWPNRTRRPS